MVVISRTANRIDLLPTAHFFARPLNQIGSKQRKEMEKQATWILLSVLRWITKPFATEPYLDLAKCADYILRRLLFTNLVEMCGAVKRIGWFAIESMANRASIQKTAVWYINNKAAKIKCKKMQMKSSESNQKPAFESYFQANRKIFFCFIFCWTVSFQAMRGNSIQEQLSSIILLQQSSLSMLCNEGIFSPLLSGRLACAEYSFVGIVWPFS